MTRSSNLLTLPTRPMQVGLIGYLLSGVVGCPRSPATSEEPRATKAPSASASSAPAMAERATPVASGAPASASAAPAREPPKRPALIEAVHQWNAALLSRDRESLERVYADKVAFYGQKLTRAQVVARKLAALAKAPDYSQTISELSVERRNSDHPQILFEKQWVTGGKPGKVQARLSLTREQSRWVVAEETDTPTEARFSQSGPYSDACKSAVVQLVTSTATGQAYLTSRGPSSDYPPNSARFETYDWPKPRVAIQENNEGYRVTVAWFEVDVSSQEVVELILESNGLRAPLMAPDSARQAVKVGCKGPAGR